MRKQSWFIRFLVWLGILKVDEITTDTYKQMCRSAQSVCNRNCSSCIWSPDRNT